MRRLAVSVVMVAMLGLSACCSVERRTIDRLDASLTKQHEKFLRYVEADPNLIEAQKKVERDNVASQKNLLNELKKAAK